RRVSYPSSRLQVVFGRRFCVRHEYVFRNLIFSALPEASENNVSVAFLTYVQLFANSERLLGQSITIVRIEGLHHNEIVFAHRRFRSLAGLHSSSDRCQSLIL